MKWNGNPMEGLLSGTHILYCSPSLWAKYVTLIDQILSNESIFLRFRLVADWMGGV